MAFVSLTELEALLARPVDPVRGNMVLEAATAAIQGYTGQTITLVTNDYVVFESQWGRDFILPERPVTDLGAVVLDGDNLVIGHDFTLVGNTLWTKSGSGWRGPEVKLEVTYSHGVSPAPPAIKAATLLLGARYITNPDSVASETVDGYQVTYANTEETGGLPPDVEALCRPWKRWK